LHLARLGLVPAVAFLVIACFGDDGPEATPQPSETPVIPAVSAPQPFTLTSAKQNPVIPTRPYIFDVAAGPLADGTPAYAAALRPVSSWKIERLDLQDPNSQIGLYNPATDSWQAFDFPGPSAFEAVTPDGTRAALQLPDGKFILIDLASKTYRRLPFGALSPSFSPDGSRLLVTLWDENTPENESSKVVIDFANPNRAFRLPLGKAQGRRDQGALWLTNTTILAITQRAPATLQLIDVSGPAPRIVAEHPAPSQQFALSPDDKRIAFQLGEDLKNLSVEIYTLDPFSHVTTLAGASLGQDYFVPSDVWSRDGARILATLDLCQDTERLVAFDLATGAQTELARGGFMRFVFSPDGRWVAYTSFGTNAYVVSADGKSPPQFVSDDVAAPFTPTWSQDSRYAAFQANFGGYDRCLI
jgi:hypothetical protein